LKGKVELSNTSDSLQISYDADLILSIWKDEQDCGKLHVSVEKQRDGGGAAKQGLLSVVTGRMKLYDLSEADTAELQAMRLKAKSSKDARKKKSKSPEVAFAIDTADAA
jgi:hypothetical protein